MVNGMMKSIALRGCHNLIAELGGAPERVARAAGLSPQAFTDPDLSVNSDAVATYFDLAARHCGAEDFGLKLAKRQGLQILGPVWVMARNAAIVREALSDVSRHIGFFATSLVITLRDEPSFLAVAYDASLSRGVASRQMVELGLASLCLELRNSLGPAWRPAAVQFRHSAPADLSAHRQAFGDHLLFDQERNAVLLDKASADHPMRDQNDRARRMLAASLKLQAPGDTACDVVRVELAVRAMIPSGRFDLPAVAGELGLCTRTLQMRLKRRGASFQRIVDQVRVELAEKYLRQSRLSAAEIAELLHFADSSALSRFMKLKAGATPSDIRRGAPARPPAAQTL